MEVPSSNRSTIFEPKGVYYFSSDLLNTAEPHYFVIVEIQGTIFHMVVCTTKFEKRVKYHKFAGFDSSTLVRIQPDPKINEIKKECYVDCNNVFSIYTEESLQEKLENGILQFKGHISDSEYYQVMNGIINSGEVEQSIANFVKKAFDEFNS